MVELLWASQLLQNDSFNCQTYEPSCPIKFVNSRRAASFQVSCVLNWRVAISPGISKLSFKTKAFQCPFTWCSAPWDLHVELDSVHAEDGVSNMAQHVSTGCYTHKCWQLLQLLKLGLPPERRQQVQSMSKITGATVTIMLQYWDMTIRGQCIKWRPPICCYIDLGEMCRLLTSWDPRGQC